MGSSKKIVIDGVRKNIVQDGSNQIAYYTGTFDSSIAKEILFVPVMKNLVSPRSPIPQTNNGYQRPGLTHRMRKFAKHLHANPLAIVPPILISTRGKWKFVAGENAGFGLLQVNDAGAIIDGQHRVGGFIILYENEAISRSIDFVAYDHLNKSDEADVFNTINGNAKGVPKGVGKIIEGSWSTQVAVLLGDSPGSPFYQKIYIAAKKELDGALFNVASFDKEIKKMFSHGSFTVLVEEEDIEKTYGIAERYWEIISEAFPEEWADIHEKPRDQKHKLLELTGIIAWSLAASDILGPHFDPNSRDVDWEEVRVLIDGVANSGELDLLKDGEFQFATGAVGGPKIHRKIQKILAELDL